MNEKKRVLFVGEASYLATGFSTYWNEVIKRIYATGEFEIAEFGSYAHDDDPRVRAVPWRFYPNVPAQNDKQGQQIYHSRPTNQFGEWRFEQVLLDFKPDCVVAHRDWWMDEFMLRSPLRDKFAFIWMPTIDGAPQRDLWLDSYRQCDRVLTYSQWGFDLLKNEGGPGIPLVTVASPGADLEVFKPVPDKRQHKARSGLPPDAIIVGTVMRNQKRKLYYDLIEAFAGWVRRSKSKGHLDLARRTFLYLHTSYPDVGYDVGKAIREFNVGNRVLLTYVCNACGVAYPSFFAGDWTHCRHCNQLQAHPPNASQSVSRETLAHIINLFDLYVQYSICEGWGMPLTEANACGVPTMALPYSAMVDHLECPGAIPIDVERFFYEPVIETEQRRALPDNRSFQRELDKFLRLSPVRRQEISKQVRDWIAEPVEVYGQGQKLPRRNWERCAAIWANVIRECPIKDRTTTWLNPRASLCQPDMNPPNQNMTNARFVRWAITRVWCRPEMVRSFMAGEWTRWLNAGFRLEGPQRVPIDRNAVVKHFAALAQRRNEVERMRVASLRESDPNQVPYRVI